MKREQKFGNANGNLSVNGQENHTPVAQDPLVN